MDTKTDKNKRNRTWDQKQPTFWI